MRKPGEFLDAFYMFDVIQNDCFVNAILLDTNVGVDMRTMESDFPTFLS